MISAHQITSMMATAFVILIIPGPSVLFIVSRGVSMGSRAALASVVGNSVGAARHAVAAALGAGAVVARSTMLFNAMRLAGAVWAQMLALGLIFVAMGMVSDGLYGIAAGSVRSWFERSPARCRAVGAGSGIALIGLGVRVAFTGPHD